MRHDVSRTERITCTHIHTIASACQIRVSLWFWPLFFDLALLWEIQDEKFFILFFRRSQQFPPPPTPLPLTLARGHPPVDGTIPAAFDTEFALQPTAISWFCNKSKWKRRLSLSLLHRCDLIWLQGAELAKKTSQTSRLIRKNKICNIASGKKWFAGGFWVLLVFENSRYF